MSDNWVVQNLENALNTWNEKLAEIWQIITQSPEQFKGGTIWDVIVGIHGAVQAIGLALEQIRTIDKQRLKQYIGLMPDHIMARVDKALAISLAMNGEGCFDGAK